MLVLLPTNMTSDVVSDLMESERLYNCTESPSEQGALKGKIAEVCYPKITLLEPGSLSRLCMHV